MFKLVLHLLAPLAPLLALGWAAACDLLVLQAPFAWTWTGLVVLVALAMGAPMVLKLFWPRLAPDAIAPQSPPPEAEYEESPGSLIIRQLAWGFGLLLMGILGWYLEFIATNFLGFLVLLAFALLLRAMLPVKIQAFLGLRSGPDDASPDGDLPEGERQRRRNQVCLAMFYFGFVATWAHVLVLGFLSDFGWHWGTMPMIALMLGFLGLLLGMGVLIPGYKAGHRLPGKVDRPHEYPFLRGIALALAIFVLNMGLEAIQYNQPGARISVYIVYAVALALLPVIVTMMMPELRRWPWPWITRPR